MHLQVLRVEIAWVQTVECSAAMSLSRRGTLNAHYRINFNGQGAISWEATLDAVTTSEMGKVPPKEKTQRPGQRPSPSETGVGKVIKFIWLHKSLTSLYRLDMKSTYVPIEIQQQDPSPCRPPCEEEKKGGGATPCKEG